MEQFFIVAGLVILVFAIGRIIRRRSGDHTGDSRTARRGGLEDSETCGENIGDKYAQAENIEKHLENRILAMKALIAEADERIDKLARLTDNDAGADNGQSSDAESGDTGNDS